MKLLVLDGNSIVNRAFYGIKLLSTKDGRYTNAIYGFLNILSRLLADHAPDEVAIAFDLKAPTFRHKLYQEYKGTRKSMPQELAEQLPVLKEILQALGFVLISREGWEADDLLGTLALACKKRGDSCYIATGDKDSLQLVSPEVTVLLASSKGGKSQTVVMDCEAVQAEYGVLPHQLVDAKALMGDNSDNIPGIPGIGPKTALPWIATFGTLENLYQNIEDKSIKPSQRNKLIQYREQAELSRELAEIRCDAPIPTEIGSYCKQQADYQKTKQLFSSLEMLSMMEKFQVQDTSISSLEHLPTVQPQRLQQELQGEILLFYSQEQCVAMQGQAVYWVNSDQLEQMLANSFLQLRVFDAKVFYKLALERNIRCNNIVFDAKLAAYLLNPSAKEYTLTQLAEEYQIAYQFYCSECLEAGRAEALMQQLQQECKQAEMDILLNEMEIPLSQVLAEMELLGVEINQQGLKQFGQALHQELENLLQEIYQGVGYEFNLNSPKQLSEALFEKLELPTRKKTKSGYSTDAETLESLKQYHPVIEKILKYRTYQKLYSTYAEGLLKEIREDGRIHSTFNQTETRTGRISSNEPNLQNIPIRTELGSKLREYFVAKEGCVFLDADYSQIELRIMAHIAQDEAMQQAFVQGQDIHQATAAKLYGVDPAQVTPRMRSSVKAVNFGILYGKGSFSLAQDLGISIKEAEQFIQTYLGAYPKVKEYMEKVVAQGIEQGFVTTLCHRRRSLPELSSSNKTLRARGERMALNTPIQGTAADIIKLAMVRVSNRLYAENLKAKLILQVHDELIVECPVEEIEKASHILKEEMESAMQLTVPLTAEVNQGKNWSEAH